MKPTKQNFAFNKQYIRKLVFYTCLSNFMSRRFQKKYTWETPNDFVTNDTYNAVILECFNVQSSFWALMKGYT